MDSVFILPTEFGAVGDGIADDTAALQAALDEAGSTGRTLLLTPGKYRVAPLRVPASVCVKSDPTWDYGTVGRTVLLPVSDSQKCVLDLNGAYGSTLEGFCVCGENRGEGMCGLLIDRNAFVREDCFRLEKLKVMSFSGHAVWFDSIWCFSVRHCMFAFSRGDGLRIRGWDAFIEDNWFSGNGGAGYSTYDANASITMTGNRIEWNRAGGIVIRGGQQYNITGNYIDRSGCGGIIITGRPCAEAYDGIYYSNVISVTGNLIYRSGKDAEGPDDSCHMLLTDSVGLTVTGNTMCVGRDDGWKGRYSPDCGMILRNLGASVVMGNSLPCGALRQLVKDDGRHSPDTVIRDNVGSVVPEGAYTGQPHHPLNIPYMMEYSDEAWYNARFGKQS